MATERLTSYETPSVPLPTNPDLIFANDCPVPVHKYIAPEIFMTQLKLLVKSIDFKSYDAIVYNLNGGKFPFELIKSMSNDVESAIPIQYQSSGKIVVEIPNELYDKRI